MVKIAVAGGSGLVAREIIDVLVATNKHDIIILSRQDHASEENTSGITWYKVDYGDKAQLTQALGGVHTVLCFFGPGTDPGSAAQKLLIDASIAAGVKRYAPSEWASSTDDELPWYTEKLTVRAYLRELNKDKKVLEYTLFQQGLFLDYFAPPGTSIKHIQPLELFIDLQNRRALTIDGQEGYFTLTTAKDLANVVARAIDYEGDWPAIGGINGNTVSTSELLEIAIKARGGKPFDITSLKEEDVRAGDIRSSWTPRGIMPNIPPEQYDAFSKTLLISTLLSGLRKTWVVSDEWNKLLPDYKFADAEEFLSKHWAGIP